MFITDLEQRRYRILEAIVEAYVSSASPVGSELIAKRMRSALSPATIRNEMQVLGDQGFIEQPHISAGRIPTAIGYRAYVQEFMKPSAQEKKVRQKFESLREQYFHRKDQERAYEAVALLSHMIPNVAFATVPHKQRVYFLGLAHALRQQEFLSNPALASGVVEVLEERLTEVLDGIKIDNQVRYYIGDEHVLPQIQSCSLMVTGYNLRGHTGVIGILGHMRMDYAYNAVALELVADLLRSNN